MFVMRCYVLRVPVKAISGLTGSKEETITKYLTLIKDSIRVCFEDQIRNENIMFGGEGKVVEIDEAFLSRRKYYRGRKQAKEGVWVVGLTEVDTSTREVNDPLVLQHVLENEARMHALSLLPRRRLKKAKKAARIVRTAFEPSLTRFRVIDGGTLVEEEEPEDVRDLEREIRTLFSQRRKGLPKKTLFFIVESRDAATLTHIIKKFVEPGSTIYTDEWAGYCNLSSEGFDHKTICHQRRFSRFEWDENAVTRITTNHIERMWVELRKTLKAMSVRDMERYILLEPYRLLNLYKSTNENVMKVWSDFAWYGWLVK